MHQNYSFDPQIIVTFGKAIPVMCPVQLPESCLSNPRDKRVAESIFILQARVIFLCVKQKNIMEYFV